MPDLLHTLAELGAASRAAVWAPVLAWTVLAVVADAALRLGRPSQSVGLWTRGALLALLPALLIVPAALAPWVPAFRTAPPPPDLAVAAPIAVETAPALPALPTAGVATSVSILDVMSGLVSVLAVAASLVALGVLAGGLSWLIRYRRGLEAAAAPVQADARALLDRLGLRRAVEVMALEPSAAPFTVGWRRPMVAIPSDLSGEPLQFALAHEMAHVRDAHFEWHLAERVVRALFVWHPLVHVLGRGLALDRERAADAAVVRLWPERAERYGRLLATFASQPAPPLALAASSSTLLHRLTAMTRLRSDRRRLARTIGLVLFAFPLFLVAATVPDQPDAVPPTAEVAPTVPPDTLDSYIESRRGRHSDQGDRVELGLKAGTPRSVAVAIADYYADGDVPGELAVMYDGGTITRSTLREGALPPPPPPPPAPRSVRAPEPPAAPEPPSAAPASPTPPAAPEAPAAAPAPPAPPSAYALSDDQLDRYVEVIQSELLAVKREIDALEGRLTPEAHEARLRLDIRQNAVLNRYRTAVSIQEERRLDAHLRAEVGGSDG